VNQEPTSKSSIDSSHNACRSNQRLAHGGIINLNDTKVIIACPREEV